MIILKETLEVADTAAIQSVDKAKTSIHVHKIVTEQHQKLVEIIFVDMEKQQQTALETVAVDLFTAGTMYVIREKHQEAVQLIVQEHVVMVYVLVEKPLLVALQIVGLLIIVAMEYAMQQQVKLHSLVQQIAVHQRLLEFQVLM